MRACFAEPPAESPSTMKISEPSAADDEQSASLPGSLSFLTAEGYAASLPEAAMRFAWSTARLSTVLVGFSSHDHLEQALIAAERGALPVAAIDRLHQAWQAFPAMLR